MPVKRRLAKQKPRITPEARAAFEAGDKMALHRELKLPPWMASPLEVDDPHPPSWAGQSAWATTWPEVWTLRQALLEAAA